MPLAVIGLSCSFPDSISLGKFWEKTLVGGIAASTGDGNGTLYDDAPMSECAAEALSTIGPQRDDLLLVISGLGDSASADLARKIGCNTSESIQKDSEAEAITEAINTAVSALNQRRCNLVLMVLAEQPKPTVTGTGFIALERLDDAAVNGHHIYATIKNQLQAPQLQSRPSQPQSSSSSSNAVVPFEATVRGLLASILSVYHATLPPLKPTSRARPWIVPGYDDLHTVNRTALLQNPGSASQSSLVSQYINDAPRRLLTARDSEIFVIQASNVSELLGKMRGWIGYLRASPEANPIDLSYSMSQELQSDNHDHNTRIAITAASAPDLFQKLSQTEIALGSGSTLLPQGVFYSAIQTSPRKLAFMLPGLGSAYPDMLLDLCLHYPEVREVFDYVDGMALAEGEKTLPSTLLFPNIGTSTDGNIVGTAMLATMDSAVITVLMVEWAIFMLLRKFGIKPDALVGCSTGEFAAFTMGGVADIVKAARMFYQLSVSVARSLPKERLLNLASIKVDAGGDAIEPVMQRLGGDSLFLTAEFTSRNSIVTGSREAIARATELLKELGIEFHNLPVAIPYHTPLVEGAISATHDEIAQLQLSAPSIPIWSCATAALYGSDVEVMRRTTTELFAKTILFERTIKAVYASGIDTFIEVGPRDNLASFASETFVTQGVEATILRSDIMGRSSITQMNYLLAELFCLGFDIDFSVLFESREVKRVGLDRVTQSAEREQVVISYMEGLKTFHQQLMEVQAQVLNEYLASK